MGRLQRKRNNHEDDPVDTESKRQSAVTPGFVLLTESSAAIKYMAK